MTPWVFDIRGRPTNGEQSATERRTINALDNSFDSSDDDDDDDDLCIFEVRACVCVYSVSKGKVPLR